MESVSAIVGTFLCFCVWVRIILVVPSSLRLFSSPFSPGKKLQQLLATQNRQVLDERKKMVDAESIVPKKVVRRFARQKVKWRRAKFDKKLSFAEAGPCFAPMPLCQRSHVNSSFPSCVKIAWHFDLRGLPPKLAAMASALSALPNDRMRSSPGGPSGAQKANRKKQTVLRIPAANGTGWKVVTPDQFPKSFSFRTEVQQAHHKMCMLIL